MFLLPPGREDGRRKEDGRRGANQLVGLNRKIIQTGWGIGDPLHFHPPLAPLCILSQTTLSVAMNITALPFYEIEVEIGNPCYSKPLYSVVDVV